MSSERLDDATPPAPVNPWPGLASYTEQERALFFGRERETAELLRLVERESLTVLFGRSGLGKTSLLKAGVIPDLRQRSYFPVVLRLDYSGQGRSPTDQIRALVLEEAQSRRVEVENLTAAEQELTLWEFLHTVEFWSVRNDRLTPVLLFDQFEEVFTIGRDVPSTSGFVGQLADLIENRIPRAVHDRIEKSGAPFTIDSESQNYKVVLSLRDDFVSKLDSLRLMMPAVMRNRLALDPLDGQRALAVIHAGGEWVDANVAQDIVDAVVGRTSQTDEQSLAASHAEIEPAYLSVMCHELFRRTLALGQTSITRDLVAQERGGILEGLYERSFEALDRKVRLFVEDRLVTPSGFRMALPLAEARAEDISAADLNILVDRRLLRFEDRLGTRHIELSHDLLTPVVQKSRDERRSRLALEAEARKQSQLRRQLVRSRIRTVVASVLAAVFLAILVLIYFAYFHTFDVYTADVYKKQFGVNVPVGSLSASAVKHRYVSFKFTRQGFKPFNGRILALEAIDSSGQCNPERHGITTVLRGSDRSVFTSDGECRWEFIYNAQGQVAYEIARNRLGQMIWGFVYSPTNQSNVRKAMFVGPDGYPQPQGKRPAEYIEITYSKEGYETKHRFMDRDGKPAPGPDGAFGRIFEYDARGRRTKDTSLDSAGMPMNDMAGNASGVVDYDSDGNEASWTALDKEDRPTLINKYQYARTRYKYDAWGNQIEGRAFDELDKPTTDLNWSGSIFKAKYDDRGNRVETRYYLDEKPIELKTGIHLIKSTFDAHNYLTSRSYFGAVDEPVSPDPGWHEVRYEYDNNGFVNQTSYFGDSGQPIEIQGGFHMVKQVNDDYGRGIEIAYYDSKSRPVVGDKHCFLYRRTYDERGKLTEEACFDYAGGSARPVRSSTFIPIIRYQYDRFGNESDVRAFDTTGLPASTSTGLHEIKSAADESGHVISDRYYDKDGKPVALNGYHDIEKKFKDSWLVEERYFGTRGEPVAKDGIHRTVYEYNQKHQETKREFFDTSGLSAKDKDGNHVLIHEYDRAGHLLSAEPASSR